MSYPDYPNNRLIVDGVDLTEKYQMILSDGYTLEPPEPKTYTVDIPGGDGVIDLTDALTGDTVYKNRKQEFVFYIVGANTFERVKTEVSNFLHGKSFDYKITMDPDYIYHGRFRVTSYTHEAYSLGIVGVIKISIDAEPYKKKETKIQCYNVSTGVIVYPISGRKTVQPKFEFSDDTKVIFNNKKYVMPAGTYTIEDIWFKQGGNEIFFMSQNATSNITHREMMRYTHSEIKSSKPIFKWLEGIKKYYISSIKLEPSSSEISGTITFTAKDQNGVTYTSTIDLVDKKLVKSGDVCDSLEIEGNTARLIRRLVYDETEGQYVEDVVPTVFTFEFIELFSNDSEIVELRCDAAGICTYTTDSINTKKEFIKATHNNYMESGEYAMTHSDMKKYRISQLLVIDTDTRIPITEKNETVYIDYEWRDL